MHWNQTVNKAVSGFPNRIYFLMGEHIEDKIDHLCGCFQNHAKNA